MEQHSAPSHRDAELAMQRWRVTRRQCIETMALAAWQGSFWEQCADTKI
jgi:hypothetical protein